MAWRRPNRRVYNQRIARYRRYISDDVVEFLAWRLPLRSEAARRLVKVMKKMVDERFRAESARDDRYTYQNAIDDTTSDILTAIENGEEVDWSLYYLTSP